MVIMHASKLYTNRTSILNKRIIRISQLEIFLLKKKCQGPNVYVYYYKNKIKKIYNKVL
ncbi:hypothetical protein HanIR_Chr13g0634921 [Helianthus annuus]|nr:hypothetical protein HanIR_Chr13g0634921 [Helianthus annuus]